MFNFLKKFKKVKPAKFKSYVEEERVFPNTHLFWGDTEKQVEEDGLTFNYLHRECFLGNSDNEQIAGFNNEDAFVMRVLTGENNGGFYIPTIKDGDVIVTVPQKDGDDVVYTIAIENFAIGGTGKEWFKVDEIQKYLDGVNANNKKFAKDRAMVEAQRQNQ